MMGVMGDYFFSHHDPSLLMENLVYSLHVLTLSPFPYKDHKQAFLVPWITLRFFNCFHIPPHLSQSRLLSTVLLFICSLSPTTLTTVWITSLHLTATRPQQGPESLTGPVHCWEVIPARQPRRDWLVPASPSWLPRVKGKTWNFQGFSFNLFRALTITNELGWIFLALYLKVKN